MPIYEYKSRDENKSCPYCVEVFENMQSILSDPLTVCPKCGNEVIKLISLIAGRIIKGRQPNQYSDVIGAKYWRDQNGNRHRVTNADGLPSSPTVSSRKYRSDEEVKAIKKRDLKERTKRLSEQSYKRFEQKAKNKRKK